MLGLAAVPAVLQAFGLLFLTESPRWLYKTRQNEKASKALQQIYNGALVDLKPIINEQLLEAMRVKEFEHYSYWDLLRQLFTKFRRCLIVGCGVQMFQQLCGINTAMYYGPEIMKMAGFGDDKHKEAALISSLPLAGVNAVGGIIACFFIDRFGRRWIMLRTLPFVALFMGVIGLGMGLRNHASTTDLIAQEFGKWFAAAGLFLYLMSFAVGMGPTPWTVNSEIYPLHLRGTGNSLSATTNWISNFAVSISFLTLLKDVPFGDVIAFLLILVFAALGFIFVYFLIPETKGLSLDKVLSLFVKEKDTDRENEKIL